MRVLIISEGPSDREMLKAILKKVKNNIEFIDESKTQMKRRGKQSILFKYPILAKFLHHGFSSSAEIIIICVDNCQKIRQIESIDKSIIKIETYGKSNVYVGWAINRESINFKILKINNEAIALDKMRCLPGFKDFEDQLK